MTRHEGENGPTAPATAPRVAALEIYESYMRSPYLSVKHSSYFQVYSELLEPFRNRPITFVEVGVLNGGSLFMWRDFLGPSARIIGVDLNPGAKRWEADGFEIHIGSQSDPEFWASLFRAVGPVDVVLDDGGHTFEQQIVTTHSCIPHIRDGGLMIIEDTHTSYFRDFGFPSRYSFIEWAKRLVDNVNSRFPSVKASKLPYKESVYSVTFYESIVCLRIDRTRCFESAPTSNQGKSLEAQDFRHHGSRYHSAAEAISKVVGRIPVVKRVRPAVRLKNLLLSEYSVLSVRHRLRRIVSRYF